jgi:hypothetical protein
MPDDSTTNLSDRLWDAGTNRSALEGLLSSFLGRYAIPVARFEHAGQHTTCVVHANADQLDRQAIEVVSETLRQWLPPGLEFQILVMA